MYFKFPADGSIERYFQRFSRRVRGTSVEIPFNCNDVFRDENKEMKEGERGRRKKERGEKRRKGDGIKRLRTRTIRWKKKRDETLCRKPRGWTREREKNMPKDRTGEGKKGGQGKKNPRDGKHYINSEMLAPSTRPISNGSTHYDNCILRIYKTK